MAFIQSELFVSNVKDNWFSNALEALSVEVASGWPDKFGLALRESITELNKEPIRVLSLFSGAGGLDIGFHDSGFKIVECNELEQKFANTLLKNAAGDKRLQGTNVVCRDIREYHPEVSDIDFIIGGPPCQTFSAAGARAAGVNGTDDDRGNLFKEYVRILKSLKPKGFLFENVYRIVGAQGGKAWQEIQESFQQAGYKLFWRVVDAADYGVPQFRERLIIVGLKDGEYKFPRPTHGPDSAGNHTYYTAKDAVSSAISIQIPPKLSGRHGHLLDDIPPGLNYSFYTERMNHPTPIFGWRSKFSDYLYKADPETPVRTIKAQGGQYTGPFHWESRPFTIEEFKRLQTFPDDYSIEGNRQKVIHQLGNSVPPQLSRIFAISILDQVFKKRLPFEVDYISESDKLGFRTRKSSLTDVYAKKAADAIAKLDYAVSKPIHSSKVSYVKPLDDLRLIECTPEESDVFIAEMNYEKSKLQIKIREQLKVDDFYTINITPRLNKINSDLEDISIRVESNKKSSVLVAWKYLETVVKELFHKDDLVQMFGYYQAEDRFKMSFSAHTETNSYSGIFWKVLSHITSGQCVSKMLHISELSELYSLNPDELVTSFKDFKKIGFEIRNSNTNKQIKKDFYLIPYAFPSLNERSLQRLTEL